MTKPLTFAEVDALVRLEGGDLFWRGVAGKQRAGKRAGYTDKEGYVCLRLYGRHARAHRVVWMLVNGEWPPAMIDHINGNPADNRPENLRVATTAQNQHNRKASSSCGFKGVTRHSSGRYQVSCKSRYVGIFATAEDAAKAYDAEALRLFGSFARLNFPRACEVQQ